MFINSKIIESQLVFLSLSYEQHQADYLLNKLRIRIENTKPEIILGNVNSVLKEKRVFKELKESEPVSTPEEQANLEEILREKIKFYEELIQEAQGEG